MRTKPICSSAHLNAVYGLAAHPAADRGMALEKCEVSEPGRGAVARDGQRRVHEEVGRSAVPRNVAHRHQGAAPLGKGRPHRGDLNR